MVSPQPSQPLIQDVHKNDVYDDNKKNRLQQLGDIQQQELDFGRQQMIKTVATNIQDQNNNISQQFNISNRIMIDNKVEGGCIETNQTPSADFLLPSQKTDCARGRSADHGDKDTCERLISHGTGGPNSLIPATRTQFEEGEDHQPKVYSINIENMAEIELGGDDDDVRLSIQPFQKCQKRDLWEEKYSQFYTLNLEEEKQKILKKKKPPRKPLSPYIFFSQEKRKDIKKQKNLSAKHIMKLVSKYWQEIKDDKSQIEKYEYLSLRDREVYADLRRFWDNLKQRLNNQVLENPVNSRMSLKSSDKVSQKDPHEATPKDEKKEAKKKLAKQTQAQLKVNSELSEINIDGEMHFLNGLLMDISEENTYIDHTGANQPRSQIKDNNSLNVQQTANQVKHNQICPNKHVSLNSINNKPNSTHLEEPLKSPKFKISDFQKPKDVSKVARKSRDDCQLSKIVEEPSDSPKKQKQTSKQSSRRSSKSNKNSKQIIQQQEDTIQIGLQEAPQEEQLCNQNIVAPASAEKKRGYTKRQLKDQVQEQPQKKRRGRKPGSNNSKSKKVQKLCEEQQPVINEEKVIEQQDDKEKVPFKNRRKIKQLSKEALKEAANQPQIKTTKAGNQINKSINPLKFESDKKKMRSVSFSNFLVSQENCPFDNNQKVEELCRQESMNFNRKSIDENSFFHDNKLNFAVNIDDDNNHKPQFIKVTCQTSDHDKRRKHSQSGGGGKGQKINRHQIIDQNQFENFDFNINQDQQKDFKNQNIDDNEVRALLNSADASNDIDLDHLSFHHIPFQTIVQNEKDQQKKAARQKRKQSTTSIPRLTNIENVSPQTILIEGSQHNKQGEGLELRQQSNQNGQALGYVAQDDRETGVNGKSDQKVEQFMPQNGEEYPEKASMEVVQLPPFESMNHHLSMTSTAKLGCNASKQTENLYCSENINLIPEHEPLDKREKEKEFKAPSQSKLQQALDADLKQQRNDADQRFYQQISHNQFLSDEDLNIFQHINEMDQHASQTDMPQMMSKNVSMPQIEGMVDKNGGDVQNKCQKYPSLYPEVQRFQPNRYGNKIIDNRMDTPDSKLAPIDDNFMKDQQMQQLEQVQDQNYPLKDEYVRQQFQQPQNLAPQQSPLGQIKQGQGSYTQIASNQQNNCDQNQQFQMQVMNVAQQQSLQNLNLTDQLQQLQQTQQQNVNNNNMIANVMNQVNQDTVNQNMLPFQQGNNQQLPPQVQTSQQAQQYLNQQQQFNQFLLNQIWVQNYIDYTVKQFQMQQDLVNQSNNYNAIQPMPNIMPQISQQVNQQTVQQTQQQQMPSLGQQVQVDHHGQINNQGQMMQPVVDQQNPVSQFVNVMQEHQQTTQFEAPMNKLNCESIYQSDFNSRLLSPFNPQQLPQTFPPKQFQQPIQQQQYQQQQNNDDSKEMIVREYEREGMVNQGQRHFGNIEEKDIQQQRPSTIKHDQFANQMIKCQSKVNKIVVEQEDALNKRKESNTGSQREVMPAGAQRLSFSDQKQMRSQKPGFAISSVNMSSSKSEISKQPEEMLYDNHSHNNLTTHHVSQIAGSDRGAFVDSAAAVGDVECRRADSISQSPRVRGQQMSVRTNSPKNVQAMSPPQHVIKVPKKPTKTGRPVGRPRGSVTTNQGLAKQQGRSGTLAQRSAERQSSKNDLGELPQLDDKNKTRQMGPIQSQTQKQNLKQTKKDEVINPSLMQQKSKKKREKEREGDMQN